MECDPFALDEVPRRVMPLIFIIDTSGSMSGAKIASLNTAARESLGEVGEISKNNSDAQIKIECLQFSSGTDWSYGGQLQDSENVQWQDLSAGGLTSLGAAYEELNQKLSRSHGFMCEPSGTRSPAMILMSDGEPTDDYHHALEKLNGNPWFKYGVKVAIAIGDDANKDVLKDFTGNWESVLTVHDIEQLKKVIHTVTVTSSMVNSQNTSVGTSVSSAGGAGITAAQDPQLQTTAAINNAIQSDPSLQGVDMGNSTSNSGTDDWNKW